MAPLLIEVVFGLDGVTPHITGSQPTTVSPDPSPGSHSGSPVIWYFLSYDKSIVKARIDFADQHDAFFPSQGGGPASTGCEAGFSDGMAAMWGRTPHLPQNGWRASKYTITAYDNHGALGSYELDPTVITVDP